MNRTYKAAIIILACLLTGCSFFDTNQEHTGEVKEIQIAEQAFQINYEVPVLVPNVLVNQMGYLKDSEKKVLFKGELSTKTFYVLDRRTHRVVFEGRAGETVFDKGTGESYATGSFTFLNEEGAYYIQMDGLGESYPFKIEENRYDDLFLEVSQSLYQKRYHKKISKEFMEAMNYLLLAYELYPTVFTDETGTIVSKNQIPDILDELQGQTQGLLTLSGLSVEEELWRIAILSKFAYAYKDFDKTIASICLTEAERAYAEIDPKNFLDDIELETLYFYSAAELYRSVGLAKYRTTVLNYFDKYGQMDDGGSIRYFATLTYLDTKYKVNFQICNEQMERMMDQTAQVSKSCRLNPLGISYLFGTDLDGILSSSVYISIGTSIITNHEYTMLLEGYLHYLSGCNMEAASYVEGYGYEFQSEEKMMDASLVRNAKFLLLLSGILANQ